MEAEQANANPFTGETLLLEEDNILPDFLHLTKILPEEVWRLIARRLLTLDTGTDDMENLSNSSSFFRSLISPSEYIFKKVLALVAPIVWKKEGLTGFPVKDVLKCRVVCSKWNDDVDKWIPEKFQLHKDKDTQLVNIVGEAIESLLHNVEFTNLNIGVRNSNKSVHHFIRHFELSHPSNQSKGRNPMIWGNLSITIYSENEDGEIEFENEQNEQVELENYQTYSNNISTVLSMYGSYICNLSVEINGLRVYENASILREWFSHLPNLQKLTFLGDYSFVDVDVQGNFDEYKDDCPFPKLQHLQRLEVECLPDPVLNQLILKNSQISTIINTFSSGSYDFLTFPLPNMKELDMEFDSGANIEKLCSQNQCHLESLVLTYIYGFEEEQISDCVATIFQRVQEKFADTLVSFTFRSLRCNEGMDGQVWQALNTYRLNLPSLKKMSLYLIDTRISLDFLLPMVNNLEEISVFLSYKLPVLQIPKTIIRFLGFEDKMLESNIWVSFKKLRTIRVTIIATTDHKTEYRFSRKAWMEKIKMEANE